MKGERLRGGGMKIGRPRVDEEGRSDFKEGLKKKWREG